MFGAKPAIFAGATIALLLTFPILTNTTLPSESFQHDLEVASGIAGREAIIEDRTMPDLIAGNPLGPPPDGSEPLVFGESVEGRPLEFYRIGRGEHTIILDGGIHGAYEWNTIVLAEKLLDHFREHPDDVAENISLLIIPNLNPDGVKRITEGEPLSETDMESLNTNMGRFNYNYVDLNRNFDHNWESTAYWFNIEIDAGDEPFSEPETAAFRDLVRDVDPELVISYHSAAEAIYAGGRAYDYEPSERFAETYSEASGYPIPEHGATYYEVTGAASNWLYTEDIPAITVELTTHEDPEFDRNLEGVRAVMEQVSSSTP